MDVRLPGLALLVWTSTAWGLIPGGRSPRTDCLAEWRVTTRNVVPSRALGALDCQDGDPACDADGTEDGGCTFNVAVCTNQSDPARPDCVPPASGTRIRHLSAGIEPPPDGAVAACGRATPMRAALRRDRTGRLRASRRLRLRMTAVADRMRDRDRLTLRCTPAPPSCPAAGECPPNPSGPEAPNQLTLVMAPLGPDLDLGWTGAGHNLPIPGGTTLHVCLEGCDTTTNPACGTRIVTGPGTANGAVFGPPVALVAAGVPLCIVREYDGPTFTGGTANLATGALDATIGLRAQLFLTDVEHACPQCLAGRCDGGGNDGGACTVDVTVPVPGGGAAWYALSRDCPPAPETRVGTASLQVPLTTGTSVLQPGPGGDATTPCVAQEGEPSGVPPQPDACDGACDAACTGYACATMDGDDCIDMKGGVSQVCCADDTTRPCFAYPVTRVGDADAPVPPWPSPEYPKRSRLTAVATFCQAATDATTVNTVLGLPGPVAFVAPATASWTTTTACNGSGGGTPAPY